jgi:hypothetical protein
LTNLINKGIIKAEDVKDIVIEPDVLYKLKADFEKIGGLIQQNEETDAHLKRMDAEGATLNENTILLKTNPSTSAVYEELIHAEQFRLRKNDGSVKQRLLNEIEAQKILIENQKLWNIPDSENEQTTQNLSQYEKELDDYYNKFGGE